MTKSALEKQSSIPTGSDLRVLLNSEHISYGDVHRILKRKGIFVGNSEKSITVPVLSATLLRPSEFSELIETSIDRESKPKVKVSALDLVSESSDWITPLKTALFTDDFDPCANVGSVGFVDSPGIVVDSKDKIKIPYVVNRRDYSKDWVERELNFSGEVVIERQGNNIKLEVSSTHSAKETEVINRRLTSRIAKILKGAGATQSESEKRITFKGFSNIERVRFFKRLTGGHGRIFGHGSVNDMLISLVVDGPPLPDDPQIAWMNHSVKHLKIDGEKLNDIFLISEEKYYPFYHVQRIDITFPFTSAANKGNCRVGFFFSSLPKSEADKEDSELTFEFSRISYDNQVNGDAKKELSATFERAARDLIDKEYDKIVSERSLAPR